MRHDTNHFTTNLETLIENEPDQTLRQAMRDHATTWEQKRQTPTPTPGQGHACAYCDDHTWLDLALLLRRVDTDGTMTRAWPQLTPPANLWDSPDFFDDIRTWIKHNNPTGQQWADLLDRVRLHLTRHLWVGDLAETWADTQPGMYTLPAAWNALNTLLPETCPATHDGTRRPVSQ